MPESQRSFVRAALVYGVSSAFVAAFSYVTASRLPFVHEAYWAPFAALISFYPEQKATLKAGAQQLIGSAVGGAIGWASASWWQNDALIYGAAVVLAVSVCYLIRCETAARLAALSVTIITIVPLPGTPADRASHRFFEVSYGVVCAIAFTAVVGWFAGVRHRWRARAA
jgi:uncharacterized membrane protein YgaE (UPF0421/DUF939 family)